MVIVYICFGFCMLILVVVINIVIVGGGFGGSDIIDIWVSIFRYYFCKYIRYVYFIVLIFF